jgi:hypothetical protein
MTKAVEQIVDQVKQLPREEFDELLGWLADYAITEADDWDREIERDSAPGGRLASVLQRVRADIMQGKTQPLDQVLDNL